MKSVAFTARSWWTSARKAGYHPFFPFAHPSPREHLSTFLLTGCAFTLFPFSQCEKQYRRQRSHGPQHRISTTCQLQKASWSCRTSRITAGPPSRWRHSLTVSSFPAARRRQRPALQPMRTIPPKGPCARWQQLPLSCTGAM